MALKLVTPPTVEPVSLVEAKAHLRVDHADDDATINFLIAVARSHFDAVSGWMGRALINQTWELILDEFPVISPQWCCWSSPNLLRATGIKLPFPRLQSVTSIKYLDGNGDEQTIAPGDYIVDTASEPGWVFPTTAWPTAGTVPNAVTVRYIAGYGAGASDVPTPIKHAIMIVIGHYYENREQVVINAEGSVTAIEMPFGVNDLVSSFRQFHC
jgi:uncharacterized phiE125 gp8 family phage protein